MDILHVPTCTCNNGYSTYMYITFNDESTGQGDVKGS